MEQTDNSIMPIKRLLSVCVGDSSQDRMVRTFSILIELIIVGCPIEDDDDHTDIARR